MSKKQEQVVVSSPVLVRCKILPEYLDQYDKSFVCINEMCRIMKIEFPDAKEYWLEASLTQWTNSSGSRVRVRLPLSSEGLFATVRRKRMNEPIHLSCAVPRLRKLGLEPGKSTWVYVRLRYKE